MFKALVLIDADVYMGSAGIATVQTVAGCTCCCLIGRAGIVVLADVYMGITA